ncbi:GGDEF domain-containing protein [Blautia glucerasea]|uniref:GGDEF domain-containing protein n=1 Tax=Blautia TaxID=572511 RepID=UPI001D09602E|nr:GGDEF domain-containing protein [Blautia glucerasea]MCB6369147.1 GGDEF domain-containing protein [Blautia glucerasea]
MKRLRNIAVFMVICSMTAALYFGITTEMFPEKVISGKVFAENGSWTEEAQSLNYDSQLPENTENTEWIMLLQTHWRDYEIYVDSQKIYSAVNERTGAYHLFGVPRGKTLSIRYLNGNTQTVNDIKQSKVWIGDKSGIYMMLVKENLYAVVFAILALIFSILSVCAGIRMRGAWHKENCESLISLGCYILCAGIWILTDSKLLLLVTQKTGVVELVSFLSFFSLPVPLISFTKRMLSSKEKVLDVFQYLFLLMLFIYSVNYMGDLIPITFIIILEHLLMAAVITFFLHSGYRELKEHRNNKLNRVMSGYIIFCICSVFALVSFYVGNSFMYSVSYVAGIVGFVAFLADAAWISVYEQIKENANAVMYAKLAYHDMMTGLGNRTAFIKDTDADQKYTGSIAYIMADANDLKKINDNLGHQKGDELITQIASCLKQVIKNDGNCYRTGGDEFVICVKGKTRQEIETYVTCIRKELRRMNDRKDIPVSAAIGYAWTSEKAKNLDRLMQEADDAMYEDKKKMKKNR